MGREIRKVPKGWEHPKNENGHYIGMVDQTFEDAAKEWVAEFLLWLVKKHPSQIKHSESTKDSPFFWQYNGNPPDEESYRPKFDSEPTCFQIYETVSEGTPVSPVFKTKEEMRKYIINEMGHSEKAAFNFIEMGWSPSMAMGSSGILSGIEATILFDPKNIKEQKS